MSKKSKTKYTSIGGQALIEGIMMRGPQRTAMSCRLPNGKIKTQKINAKAPSERGIWFKIPLIRGIAAFIDSLSEGYKTLTLSAENAGMSLEDEELSPFEQKLMKLFGDKLYNVITSVAAVLGVVIAIVLFFYLPILMFNGLQLLINYIAGHEIPIDNFRALFEGVVKIAIFVGYVAVVSRMKEIKRVFQYHGAEHKTIFCYEAKLPLTVENVKIQSRFHPRCGTSFLIVMLLVSMIIYFLLSYFFKFLTVNSWLWLAIKLLMLPVIMGLGYEFIRYAGKHDNIVTRILSAPGLWMQRLTTKEPEDDQIEVAIAALNAVDPLLENPFVGRIEFIEGETEEDETQSEENEALDEAAELIEADVIAESEAESELTEADGETQE